MSFSLRQRAELDELRKQLEDNCALATRVLKEEYEKGKEEQERRHQVLTEAGYRHGGAVT